MSVAEKLLTIAENSRDMYTLAEGKKSAVKGNIVKADNVSGYEHSLDIKLTSDTITDFSGVKVSRYGKNLIPYPYTSETKTHNGITFAVNADGTVMAKGTATGLAYFHCRTDLELEPGTYTISGSPLGGNNYNQYCVSIYIGSSIYEFGTGKTFTITEKTICEVMVMVFQNSIERDLVFKPQLELGTTPTEYEPYKEPTTATADEYGTVNGLTSLFPNITLIPNNSGVDVECTYYTYERDQILDIAKHTKTALVGLKEDL